MSDRLIFFLLGLSGRERILLTLLVLIALPVALWVGVLQPLQQARDQARVELADTLILQQWVAEQVVDARRLSSAGEGGETAPIGIAGLERSLIAAQLRGQVTELSRRSGDAIELRFDAVPFVPLGAWLSDVSLDWGYEIANFRFEPGPETGLAMASFGLVPRR